MSEVGPGLRWRDALVLFVLGTVIVSGLVHYGRGLGDDGDPATRDVGQSPAPTRSPTAQETARLEGAPPADPAQPPAPGGGTCWDGRATTSLRLCGLPEGARGLEWVFPSFARDRAQCHQAQPDDESYPVVDSYECFQRALRRPVTVTYDRVGDPTQVKQWLLARLGESNLNVLPGPHGARYVFTDDVSRPARVIGTYERFPYVVSVHAATPQAAREAWRLLVEQRGPGQIRGVPHG
jgi:hypothetical protein